MTNSGSTGRTPVDEQALVEGLGPATSWADARTRMETPEKDRTNWLATVRPDGRPHVMPILGLWLDGAFCFISSDASRKGMNLAADARCVVTASSRVLPALDVIAEGFAVRVTDPAELHRVVDAYGSILQWPLELDGGAVTGPNAPTAGPPPYAVYKFTPTTVFGLPGIAGTDAGEGREGSFTPTRWRFE